MARVLQAGKGCKLRSIKLKGSVVKAIELSRATSAVGSSILIPRNAATYQTPSGNLICMAVSLGPDENSIATVYNRICALLCCAVCGRQTRSPVSVCSGGHAFCMSCRPDTNAKTLNIINKISDLVANDVDDVAFERALRELFECPVCYKIPQNENQYEMCARGHLVCRFCYLMTAYCPLCREAESVRKNRLIGRIMKEIRKGYKCRYSEYGCRETCDIFATLRHEDSCKYRRFSCLVEGCLWVGTTDEIFNHGRETHRDIVATGNRVRFSEGTLQVRFGDDETHPYWLLYNLDNSGNKVPRKGNFPGFSMVLQTHGAQTSLTAKVVLGEFEGPNVQFNHPVLTTADDPLTALMSQQRLEIPPEFISKYLHSSELSVTVNVDDNNVGYGMNWLSPFNVFTAAFVLQFFLFTVKHNPK